MSDHVYDPTVVEKKMQECWEREGTNEVDLAAAQNPYYVLMMFPYPSAEGLHVGNVYAFTGADVFGRHRRLLGHDVFEPIGFDAFGIHSENFAMKVNRHPRELIPSNVANFTRQLRMMGFMFDWRRTVDTTSEEYYKWTQWVFLQLYKAGLVYRDTKEVNYCPACGTVISDEQKNADGTCERHSDTKVERRHMPCWFFRITAFADRLLDNHDWLDWSETTKTAQRNWIGRSRGAEIDFAVAGTTEKIRVFTTRPDTIFGATFMVLAPDHPLVDQITTPERRDAVAEYREFCRTGEAFGSSGTGVPPVQVQPPPQPVTKRHGANLPHWTREGGVYHVVFRLADSLPAQVVQFLKEKRNDLIKTAKAGHRELTQEEADEVSRLYSITMDGELDKVAGECLFKRRELASIVANALKHFDGTRYELLAFSIMPNHVHVVVAPFVGEELPKLLHSWKSFTAKKVIEELGDGRSEVWQSEYFDHLIRNEESLHKTVEYVWKNSDLAGLQQWEHRYVSPTIPNLHGRDARATVEGSVPLKSKTGIDTGARAINPATGEPIPVFIADYVLMGYGTGAIMAVPSGDHRDFEFATKFGLPVRAVVEPIFTDKIEEEDYSGFAGDVSTEEGRAALKEAVLAGRAAWSGRGRAVNSANAELTLDGHSKDDAVTRAIEWLEHKRIGRFRAQFRLRDWGISRQRYWGPPIPIIYDEDGNAHPVPEDQLPVALPHLDDFRPKGDGKGPLATAEEWMNTTLPDGRPGRRESDVMDNFLDSAWYYLRYLSSHDDAQAFDPELVKKWLPVDMYIGGNEHAVLHLMYTRFICMGLEQAGALRMGDRPEMKDSGEPFRKFRAHGLLIKEGSKMSKSKGNVVNPDQYVVDWGADTLRLYLMFLGPFQQGGDFRDDDIIGMRRYLNRLTQWYFEGTQPVVPDGELPKELRVKTHQTLKKVREDIDSMNYNTAISATMELFNAAKAAEATSDFVREAVILALAPFAPHFADYVWRDALGKPASIWASGRFPQHDEKMTQHDEIEIALQINGKVRDRLSVARTATKEDIEKQAMAMETMVKALDGKAPKRVIIVPGRIVNVIV